MAKGKMNAGLKAFLEKKEEKVNDNFKLKNFNLDVAELIEESYEKLVWK